VLLGFGAARCVPAGRRAGAAAVVPACVGGAAAVVRGTAEVVAATVGVAGTEARCEVRRCVLAERLGMATGAATGALLGLSVADGNAGREV
jgi:hypothetical protein